MELFVVDIRDPLIWFLGFPISNCMLDASLGHRTEPVNNPPQTGALVVLSCCCAVVLYAVMLSCSHAVMLRFLSMHVEVHHAFSWSHLLMSNLSDMFGFFELLCVVTVAWVAFRTVGL